jgi:23S rRNA (uracil1939-C5)-methyltransferase
MEISAQRRIKGALLREMLRHAGGFHEEAIAPVTGTDTETAYRSRLELHVAWGAGPQLGFSARGSHRTVPIHQCLLALPPIQRWIPILREMLRRTGASEVGRVEISCDSPGEEITVLLWAGGRLSRATASRLRKAASKEEGLRGLYFAHRRGGTIQPLWERASDDPGVRFSVPGPPESEKELTLTAWPGVFRQVNPEINRLLIGQILQWVRESGGRRLLELHAGMGNLSLPLALETEEVMAVESNPRAVENAQYNARRLGIRNIIWRRSPAKRAVRDLLREGKRFHTLILDPPRQGAREVLEGILEMKPDHIFYVSCDPPTLARDLRILLQGGHYRVIRVLPLDMFPQTYHVETLSWLQRG